MLLFLSKRIVAMLLTMLSASVLVFVVLEVSPGSGVHAGLESGGQRLKKALTTAQMFSILCACGAPLGKAGVTSCLT